MPNHRWIQIFMVIISLFADFAQADILGCLNPGVKSIDDSKVLAVNFLNVNSLTSKQITLLEGFLGEHLTHDLLTNWQKEHNDQAAAFFAVTKALSLTEVELDNQSRQSALEMVDSISEIRGVRLIAQVSLNQFSHWNQSGHGPYSVHLASGEIEAGTLKFANHDQKGGGLHCGFDIQGFTHYQKVPYLHWNVNLTTGLADIHLDGFQPWFGGIIPNPIHMTYRNSDVRAWYKHYVEKYGNPGFSVAKKLSE